MRSVGEVDPHVAAGAARREDRVAALSEAQVHGRSPIFLMHQRAECYIPPTLWRRRRKRKYFLT